MTPSPLPPPAPTISREQLIAALKLMRDQLNLYCDRHDAGTRAIIAECDLTLRLAKPTSK